MYAQNVWLFDLARRHQAIRLLNTRFHEANPAFSPDRKWLAFTSDESGRPELYLQAFRSGDSPSLVGERLLVSSAGAQAVAVTSRRNRAFLSGGLRRACSSRPVRLSPKPQFGTPKALFAIATEARAAIHCVLGFDVSADGRQRFIIPVVNSAEAPSLVVIQNWEALLPHKP